MRGSVRPAEESGAYMASSHSSSQSSKDKLLRIFVERCDTLP